MGFLSDSGRPLAVMHVRIANPRWGNTQFYVLGKMPMKCYWLLQVAYAVDINSLESEVNPYADSVHKIHEGFSETINNPVTMVTIHTIR